MWIGHSIGELLMPARGMYVRASMGLRGWKVRWYRIKGYGPKQVHLIPQGYSSHVVYSRRRFDKWVGDGTFIVTNRRWEYE